MADDEKLKNIYYDVKHPASFGSVLKLARAASVPLKKAKQWLMKQDVYSLHRPVRYNFPRRKTLSYGIGELMQVDLMDLSKFSKWNKGFKFVLVAIDVFSKYAYAIPIKNKSANSLVEAFGELLKQSGPVSKIQSDLGKEFFNNKVRLLFKKNNIHHYSTFSEFKASVAERLIRTLKSKIYKIFTHRKSYKYLDVLQNILDSYNNSVHRSHGFAPSRVTPKLEAVIFEKLYGYKTDVKFKFQEGEQVRISKSKSVFRKGYLPNWTEEVFTILKRYATIPPTYILSDLKNNTLGGRFYEHEIQKVTKKSDDFWRVERILKTRRKNSEKEYFVKWLGFSDEHNSWVKESWIQK